MLIGAWVIQAVLLLWIGSKLLPVMMRFMTSHGLEEPNYKGETIPTACGLLLWLLVLLEAVTMNLMVDYLRKWERPLNFDQVSFLSYFTALSAVALVGFADDAVGYKQVKGFNGHWGLWREKRIWSTALLKAGVTVIAALLFVSSQPHAPLWKKGLDLLLLGLLTNGVNLLDLRPGRAIKGCWMMAVAWVLYQLIEFVSHEKVHFSELVSSILWLAPYVLPVCVGACLLFLPDLRAQLMMGDTGSNMLGFALGCWFIMSSDWIPQIALIVLLLWLHVVAWRSSLSRWIESNRLLLWFDLLGRKN